MESSSAAKASAPDLFASIVGFSELRAPALFAHARREAQAFGSAVAVSVRMSEVFATLRRLAPTDVTLTICGETGTGKDVIAHADHDESQRARGPFVVFDCGSVPPNLVESELFGHEKGAFTGAHAEHTGAFERAEGGTLFLDEIGELPLDLQPRLLRALENRSVRRVGGSRERRLNVRVVAATNRDMAALVASKMFRQDLYFRLAAAVVHLPPLRDRAEDLPFIVGQLLANLGRADIRLESRTLEMLIGHAWPGNVRELKNVLACALAFVDGDRLGPQHLRLSPDGTPASPLERLPLGGQMLANVERITIVQTLELTRGNKVQAARMLGISTSTLYEKLKRYGEASMARG